MDLCEWLVLGFLAVPFGLVVVYWCGWFELCFLGFLQVDVVQVSYGWCVRLHFGCGCGLWLILVVGCFEWVVGLGLVCFGTVLLILMWGGWFTVGLGLLRDVFDFGRVGGGLGCLVFCAVFCGVGVGGMALLCIS